MFATGEAEKPWNTRRGNDEADEKLGSMSTGNGEKAAASYLEHRVTTDDSRKAP